MKIIGLISGLMLLIAIAPTLPYDYYLLLRVVIFISSIIIAWKFNELKKTEWLITFIILAFVYNPIFSLHLTRAIWTPVNLVSAILFFIIVKKIGNS